MPPTGAAHWKWNRRVNVFLLMTLMGTVAACVGVVGPTMTQFLSRPRPGVQGRGYYAAARDERQPAVDISYLLYLPADYRRDNANWPLVLFLHGIGERGFDLGKLAHVSPCAISERRKLPFILLSPQCEPARQWEPHALLRLIDHVSQNYRVDADRVYVTGYSMGGYGTWELATVAPERFAAIAPLAAAGDARQASRFGRLPILAIHGELDQVEPLIACQRMADAVTAAGGNVQLTVYANQGHHIDGLTYGKQNFWDGLLLHRRGHDFTREYH